MTTPVTPDGNGTTEALNTQALLVTTHFHLPRQSRQDKAESRNVEERNHAQRGTARVNKYYFQQDVEEVVIRKGKQCTVIRTNDAIAPLRSHFNAFRAAVNGLCPIPWDTGTGVLPAKLVDRCMEVKDEMEEPIPELKQEFLSVYQEWKDTAPERMGNLYAESDFPSIDQCEKDISWEFTMIPLPDADQLKRIQLISPNWVQVLEAGNNAKIAKAIEEARAQTWKDLFDPVQHIIDVLSKDKAKLHETLLGNLHRILELAPAFNLSGDVQMDLFVTRAKADLESVTIEDLRSDPDLRASMVTKCTALLNNFGTVAGRKFA